MECMWWKVSTSTYYTHNIIKLPPRSEQHIFDLDLLIVLVIWCWLLQESWSDSQTLLDNIK